MRCPPRSGIAFAPLPWDATDASLWGAGSWDRWDAEGWPFGECPFWKVDGKLRFLAATNPEMPANDGTSTPCSPAIRPDDRRHDTWPMGWRRWQLGPIDDFRAGRIAGMPQVWVVEVGVEGRGGKGGGGKGRWDHLPTPRLSPRIFSQSGTSQVGF